MEENIEIVENVEEENHEGMVQCAHCGEWIPLESATEIYGNSGDFICNNCYEDYYTTCNDCGDVVEIDETTYIRSGGGYRVCNNCYSYGNYCYCDDCGEYFEEDYVSYNEDDDCYYCDNCYHLHCGDSRVEDYHDHHDGTYDTKYSLGTEKYDSEIFEDGMMYMGIETECSATIGGNESAFLDAMDTITLNDSGDTLLKYERDSSINRNGLKGVECISVPCTPEKLYSLEDKVKSAFDKARELGYRSDTDATGIHIHVSRPKNDEVIDRILLVLETFKDEVIKVARRHSDNWAKFLSDTMYSDSDRENLKALFYIKRKKDTGDRYMALNLTNKNTIEFRLFRGTLNYKTWYAYVEFIHNIMVQCSDLSKPVNDIKWDDLVQGKFISEYVVERDITCDKVITDTSYKFIELDNKLRLIRLHKNANGRKINKILKKWFKVLVQFNGYKIPRNAGKELSQMYYVFAEYRNDVNSIYKMTDRLSRFDLEHIKRSSVYNVIDWLDDVIFNEQFVPSDKRMDVDDFEELKKIKENLQKLHGKYQELVHTYGELAEGGDR